MASSTPADVAGEAARRSMGNCQKNGKNVDLVIQKKMEVATQYALCGEGVLFHFSEQEIDLVSIA